ncbi:Nucleoporin POM152 [Sphaceloma murrayae]|uniref:Nucleoporin POM152 n=1 Tax=Sphaceloma murrayae TaxID=2082308 RepID=A0A2K1R1U9_9PEZI|nr:Nucleoporin POM152 [Sphaceloma murrayae]
MNGTPRLSSRFPDTPQTRRPHGTPRSNEAKSRSSLPDVTALKQNQAQEGPLIPLDTIDAPQQRLLAVSFYVALLAWRLYDFHYLNEEDTESLWAFMKWVAIDGVFLFGLPELRIPWLEWSQGAMVILFLSHALLDGILMFRIPIPLGAALVAFTKLVYDRELAISERSVKYSSLMQDSSHLLGRQIIKILPEGSATLNPGREHYCLDVAKAQVNLPIQINQTIPISMNLVHFDLDSNKNETTILTSAQIKKLMNQASKTGPHPGVEGLMTLRVPVKKPGLYKLGRVTDKSGLEVRRRPGETFVVPCPRAVIKPLQQNRCKGELSNVELEVTGTPPMRVRYRKLVNHVEQEANLQSIQPEDLVSPLAQTDQEAIVPVGKIDATWARAQTVIVPLSESLGISGRWAFSLQEVEDAFGNIVSYSTKDHDRQEKVPAQSPHLHQVITVHERPTVILQGCSPQRPMKVAKGQSVPLPIQLGSTGKGGFLDSPYHIEYQFSTESSLTPAGDHGASPHLEKITMKSPDQKPRIKEAGLYSITSVSSNFCAGDVNEPASCLLQNPPEPSLKLQTEEIYDKCAQKPIGLRVDLFMTGTPPFDVQYIMERKQGGTPKIGFFHVEGLRGQGDLTPPMEGHYTYRFNEVSDQTYKSHSIRHLDIVLEQDVKPSAYASFVNNSPRHICIDESVKFGIQLRGEGPFQVEYELVRGNKRQPHKINDITGDSFEIETEPLSKGGDYTLSLASVTDGMGCKEFLKEEAKITVRHQKPKAGFGLIEGSRMVKTLENKQVVLPVRLTGDAPWMVHYRDAKDPDRVHEARLQQPNDKIVVNHQGTYELMSMRDRICPGTIDQSANKIEVQWIGRPRLSLQATDFQEVKGQAYIKHDVCEGEEDSADLHLAGSPPFEVKYDEHLKPDRGQKALKTRKLNAALGVTSIRMDTSQAGHVEYRFAELADYNYDHAKHAFTPLSIQQRVHPRPAASFKTPGKTYSYCTSFSSSVETIPIVLTGTPPFSIDYELRHSGKSQPRIHTISDIRSNNYALQIPASDLQAGTSALSLRKITDARGCTRTLPSTEPRVQISVHAAPSITPLDPNKNDYCVGDRLSFSLSGTAPFTIYYTFNNVARKASSTSTTFRRLAEKAGTFTITAIQDSASSCKADVNLSAKIHGLPSARVANGRAEEQDIHEGGSADIEFSFGGEGPWEFVWARSTLGKGGKQGKVVEMKSEFSEERVWRLKAGEEGVYEAVRVRDRYCEVKREGVEISAEGNKLLKN